MARRVGWSGSRDQGLVRDRIEFPTSQRGGNMARASLGLSIFVVAVAAQAGAAQQTAVDSKEHWVEKDGIKIYLWEKYAGAPAGKSIVVLAHGSATAGKESFDLQVP